MSVIGNQNSKKLKTKEQKDRVYKAYCEHLAQGYPKACFYYTDDELSIHVDTIDKYIKTDPDFDASQVEIAKAAGYKKWVTICMEIVNGKEKYKKNIVALQIFMRNVFGWDRPDRSEKENIQQNEEIIGKLLYHLAQVQKPATIDITSPKDNQKLDISPEKISND